MDVPHIIETAITTAFVAGVSWGAIRAELRALSGRIKACEDNIRNAEHRIDSLFAKRSVHT